MHLVAAALLLFAAATPQWPQFRGPQASGRGDGAHLPDTWSAADGKNIAWRTAIPGLAHSSPVVWGDRVFVTTAISSRKDATFKPGLYGEGTASEDVTVHKWNVLALDRRTGKVLWERTAYEGAPKEKRHIKATYANATPATDGRHVVAFFGSQGLYAYDVDGRLKWKRDLGPAGRRGLRPARIRVGHGQLAHPLEGPRHRAGRPAEGLVPDRPAARRTGRWRGRRPATSCPPGPRRACPPAGELVTNAPKFIRGYDPATGKELWRLGRSSNITAPTPVFAKDLIVVASGRRPNAPLFVVKPGARGDITLPEGATSGGSVLWTREGAGSYMPTPARLRRASSTC